MGRNIPCSWRRRLKAVKSVFLKFIARFCEPVVNSQQDFILFVFGWNLQADSKILMKG